MSIIVVLFPSKSHPTWCQSSPLQSPTSIPTAVIRVKQYLHSVGFGYDGCWWQGGTTALVHQDCPVSIGDLDIVLRTGGSTMCNFKLCELQPHYLPTLHHYRFCLVKIVRVYVYGVVPIVQWRGDNTWGLLNGQYHLTQTLTLVATWFCRAKCWLPESSSGGWVRDTRECEAVRTIATAAMVGRVLAISGSSRCNTEVTIWGRQRRAFWFRLEMKTLNWMSLFDYMLMIVRG